MARTGRPPILDEVIGSRAVFDPTTKEVVGTEPLTRLEQIVGDVRVGLNAERASKRAGIHRDTFDDWERTAAAVRKRQAQLAVDQPDPELTPKERLACEFSDAVHDAEIEWQLQSEMLLQDLAQGGRRVVITTVVEKDGQIIKQETKTSYTLPDAEVIKWRLKHRFPGEYADRLQVEGTGEDGAIPVEVRAQSLGESLAAFLEARAEQGEPPDES